MSVRGEKGLDPVTFEVLRNAFVSIVDQMAEQVRRTCYSFVVYNRDFSNSLLDAEGNTRHRESRICQHTLGPYTISARLL